tara:strand:- start:46944 stop:47267 length:324 start_codon:yes stop_codon:yes gene_type:complete
VESKQNKSDENKPLINDENDFENDQKPTFGQIVFSTLSVFLGVQSNKNRVRDFKHGNIYSYVASVLIFTILFIFCVITVVKAVLSNAGMSLKNRHKKSGPDDHFFYA